MSFDSLIERESYEKNKDSKMYKLNSFTATKTQKCEENCL